MAPITTSLVRRRHAWTGLKEPWRIDVGEDTLASLPAERRAGWRLFHYLSGGGIRAFAGSVAREAVSRRQTRFLWFMVGVAMCWLALRFV
ncbi:MAG: hypothetical protein ACI4RA_06450 [Kiritimatiellia bacterium]